VQKIDMLKNAGNRSKIVFISLRLTRHNGRKAVNTNLLSF